MINTHLLKARIKMNTEVSSIIERIEDARKAFITSVSDLTTEQVNFKPSANEWSILEIVEHIVWAEQIGICGMFKAIEGIKNDRPIWTGDSPNAGLSIEEIVERTWQQKEKSPEIAEPKWGGSVDYWIGCLENCSHMLNKLQEYTKSVDLKSAIYPHPISGPMDVIQRLEFLRFHLERHYKQIDRVKNNKSYKTSLIT